VQQLIVIGLIAHTCRFAADRLRVMVTVVKDATASYSMSTCRSSTSNIPNFAAVAPR
jgi:hypothetical protein